MADDIAALIANSARTNADFSQIGNIPKAYYEGQDQAYKQRGRNIFSDENGGLPRDKDGNVDYQKAYERVVTVLGAPAIESAGSLATSGLTQDRIRYAPTVSGIMENPGPGVTQGSAAPASVVASSASRGVPRPDSQSGRQGDSPDSLVSFVSAAGTPDAEAGPHINILGGQLSTALGRRIDPNAPLDMKDPKVRQVLAGYKRGGIPEQQDGTAPPQQQPTIISPPSANRTATAVVAPPLNRGGLVSPQSAAAPPAQPQAGYRGDPTLGGLIPPGYPDPGAYLARLQAVAASGRVLPDQLKTLEQKIGAIQMALQPTLDMKNAAASGQSLTDYQNRTDENMAQRDILTKSLLPKLDDSQKLAMAGRDEIQAIHRSREQLDQPGGIFAGSFADQRLKIAKVAEFIGVPNADKIANTEAFGSAIGSRVLSLVKNLGSGTAISNADREFAAAMAGGNIKLDDKSIRRILDIGEQAARVKIDAHNGLVDRTLKTSEALKTYRDVYAVTPPDQYQKALPPPKAGDVIDGHRFLGGNPNDERRWSTR